MMKSGDSHAVCLKKQNRFDLFKARGLSRGGVSGTGMSDLAPNNNAVPEAKVPILDLSLFGSATGLLRVVVPSLLLAGACLAGAQGARAHQPVSESAAIWPGETGIASYYGPRHQGRRTASGGQFDMRALTAAHPWLPFGTKVRVTVVATGLSVVVTITDRLPSCRRAIDLSLGAARLLGIVRQGLAKVSLTPA